MEGEDALTYPHDIACQLAEVLNIRELQELKREMQHEHLALGKPANRIPVLIDFANSGKIPSLKDILLTRIKQEGPRQLIRRSLNKPTLEGFSVLEMSGLPRDGTVIFSSTATANSGHDDAITTALNMLGWCDPEKGITYERSSTVTASGLTAVSRVPPKNPAVIFRQDCPLNQWPELSYDLARQFLQMSTGIKPDEVPHIVPKYDHMYHWGCINQCFLTSPLGHEVSCWSLHEKWNVVMTMAMMWHAIMTLKPGGQLCIKVRIFKRAETLGLVSLISCLFDNLQMVDNPRQCCTFLVVIFNRITPDNDFRLRVAETLKQAMDQDIETIFMNPIQVSEPKCKETRRMCVLHQESMVLSRARHNTIFLVGLYCMKELINSRFHERNTPDLTECLAKLEKITAETYGPLGQYFYRSFIDIEEKMHPEHRLALDIALNGEWMKINF
jgi:hypothetical protein